MRESLERRYRRFAEQHPGECFDDVLSRLGLLSDIERNRVRPRLYKMHELGGPLRDLLEKGIVVPTLGSRARCFKEFESKAKEPTVPTNTSVPAVERVRGIAAEGFVKETDRDEAVLRELKDSNLNREILARTEHTVVDRIRRESEANNRAEGWREAALAYKRLADRDTETVVRPVLPRIDQNKPH